jgi:serine/threonine protein kinase
LKKKMKRGSSKSKDSESTGAGGVSESNSPISGAKAGRKKKSKKKDIIEDDAEPAVVEQAKLTGASGQIELTKLRAFFATWDPNKAMTHSWEINPQEIEFVDMIGEGTSCAVYRGTYRGQVVALKVLKDLNTKQLTNFVKEFDIISDVRSPHVVFFFGACLDPVPVMVLGLCARGSLYDVLRASDTSLTWASVFKVCISTLKGLDSLHKWKPQIVHRDLKSRNILIEDDWAAKLCDFGESRYTTGTNIDTLCKIRGTYAYIAPEVYFGQSFTTKSDIYAFGVILWELCNRCVRGTYLAPFAEYKTLVYDFQIIVMASRKGMRPTIDPAIPSALSNLIRLCWDHEPANRPDTVQILRFFEEIATDSTRPAEWTKAKNVLEWPPAGGPGVAGSPPRTSGP